MILKYCKILAYPAINTVGDCSKASYVISACQTIKDKAKNIEPQKSTFTVGEIYWTCYDSSGGWERPVWAILLNCISFHSTLLVAHNSLLHFFTSHVVRGFFSYFVSLALHVSFHNMSVHTRPSDTSNLLKQLPYHLGPSTSWWHSWWLCRWFRKTLAKQLIHFSANDEVINQQDRRWQWTMGRRERNAINQWLSFASSFLSLSFLLWSAEEVLRWLNSQSVTKVSRQHCGAGTLLCLLSSSKTFWLWLCLFPNLYVYQRCHWVAGIKRLHFGREQREEEGLTLLSKLGIMVSVIQEPNLDPDARTVMGLLTPVNFPQPGGQRERMYLYRKYVFTPDSETVNTKESESEKHLGPVQSLSSLINFWWWV